MNQEENKMKEKKDLKNKANIFQDENEVAKDKNFKKEIDQVAVIESVIFMYGEAVKFSRLAEILKISEDGVCDLAKDLKIIYENRESQGLKIILDEESVQLVTHPDCAEVIDNFVKGELKKPLSQAALEVLAVVAYRGPISKVDVEAIRGVNCSFTLRNLLMRGLIKKTVDESDARTHLYKITFKFLRILGIDNEKDLPDYEELFSDKRIDAILYSEEELGDK
ncbi:MAG: SMC-Scp complex subunit ScpB [Candidatus Moranbacteria bacterium]|nr:SMC-Scp complex subunit ScpB [Candidatus Moranbacteria bacterium]